jgi:hypothetical protein
MAEVKRESQPKFEVIIPSEARNLLFLPRRRNFAVDETSLAGIRALDEDGGRLPGL